MPQLNLMAEYNSLVQQHQEQFAPALAQLQTFVEETLDQLREQEQALVDAQDQELAQIRTRLATDARFLLDSAELQAFVAKVQSSSNDLPRYRTDPSQTVDANSINWQLTRTDFPLAIRDYEMMVDHDAYDDERTHSAYGYWVTLQVGKQRQRLEVFTHRVYSPIEQRSYTLQDQPDDYFEWQVAELLSQQGITESKHILARESSYLFGCAAWLLSFVPCKVTFHYPSTESIA